MKLILFLIKTIPLDSIRFHTPANAIALSHYHDNASVDETNQTVWRKTGRVLTLILYKLSNYLEFVVDTKKKPVFPSTGYKRLKRLHRFQ
ncbi:hypothetical protein ACFU8X_20855 [Brevibacillus porteri]|uniref:hypothetical protein n=1 Tax=Brevibacillus porteri TaxID=2126350 RepID=UPI00370C2660